MRILITGALGFLGINLVRFFASQPNVHVVATDTATINDAAHGFLKPVAKHLEHAFLDICDRAAVHTLLVEKNITHIVHAAALTVEETLANASRVVAVNLGGSISLLDAILENNTVERTIVISSSGVYGSPVHRTPKLQREADPLNLTTLYAITKHCSELLLARYSILCGRKILAVRLPAVYGPMEYAKLSRPSTTVFQHLMTALHDKRKVSVTGRAIVRDWTYSVDIAEGIWKLLRTPRLSHSVYNISCGEGTSFFQVVQAFAALGLQISWVDGNTIADISMYPHQERTPLDITRLSDETGFRPRFNLQSAITDWLKYNPLST